MPDNLDLPVPANVAPHAAAAGVAVKFLIDVLAIALPSLPSNWKPVLALALGVLFTAAGALASGTPLSAELAIGAVYGGIWVAAFAVGVHEATRRATGG